MYFKNTSWLFTEKFLRMILSLFIGVWVVRYLGPEKFGLFSYSQSYVGLFTAFASLGLDNIVVRELIREDKKVEEIVATTFYLKLLGAIIVLFILITTIYYTSNDTQANVLIFVIALCSIFQSLNVIDFYFQSKVLSKFVVYSNVITLLLSSIVRVLLILGSAPLIYFAWALVFDSIILAIMLVYYFLNIASFNIRDFIFKHDIAIDLLKDSWPLILSGVAIIIYMKIDQIIIKELLGNKAVGQYSVAVRISELWYFIPMVIGSSLFPAIISAKKQSIKLYNSRLQMLYVTMIWTSIIIAIPVSIYADWLVELLYGKDYNQAAKVLIIHIWSGVFVFLGVASSNWLISENLQKYSLINTIIGAFLNVVLNYLFIPIIGISGAAWATLIAYFVSAYLSLFFWEKTRVNFINISKAFLFIGLDYGKKNS